MKKLGRFKIKRDKIYRHSSKRKKKRRVNRENKEWRWYLNMNKQNKRERRRDREKERIATERERMEKKMKKLRYFKMNVDKICSYSRESKKKGRNTQVWKGMYSFLVSLINV